MKTNYLQRNRSRSSNKRALIIVLAIFFAGAVAFSFLDGLFIAVVSPIWRGENIVSQGFRNAKDFFRTKSELINENNRLKQELSSYESLIASARATKERHESLLAEYGRQEAPEWTAATVLVRPPLSPYDTLIIDAGRKENLLQGCNVTTPEGVLIGTVTDVYTSSAKVRLFTSDGIKTNAVLERGELPVILIGQGGGNFKLILPRDVEVMPGDRIVAPGIRAEYLAVVGDINLRPTDSFKEVFARSPINMNTLRFVKLSQ